MKLIYILPGNILVNLLGAELIVLGFIRDIFIMLSRLKTL